MLMWKIIEVSKASILNIYIYIYIYINMTLFCSISRKRNRSSLSGLIEDQRKSPLSTLFLSITFILIYI